MKRNDCLEVISRHVGEEDLVITSLGGLMDEWYNLRPAGANLPLHILGVISPLSLGLALALPNRRVVCLDTDGSMLLNLGVLCTIGNERPRNLSIFVMDNGCYECVGGYPTASAGNTDFAAIARGAGIAAAEAVTQLDQLEKAAGKARKMEETSFVVCKIEPGTKKFPAENRIPWDGFELKYRFIRAVEKLEGIVIKPPEERYNFRADEKGG